MIRASRASAFALFGVFIASWVALAQAPTPLRPAVQTDAAPNDAQTQRSITVGPLRLTPKVSRPLATERTAAPPGTTAASLSRSVIQVEGLMEIDPNSVGSLTAENGGLGTDMWRGTPRRLIERLIPELPDAVRSPLLRDLTKRLLLSAATLPAWEDKPAEPTGPSLIVTRLRKLQAMGAFKHARELTELTPMRMQDPTLLQLQADERLLANDYSNACQIVDGAGDHLARLYWQKLLVFCQTLRGDREGAALGAGLLAETLGSTDAPYFKLIDQLTLGIEEPLISLPNPSALHLAVMRTAQVTIPDDALLTPRPSILRAIGISPNARLETRLAAAEAAAATGALTTERLAEIYMAEKYDPVELNNVLSLAAADRSPRGRALLFQAAQVESVAMARAAIYAKAFELAKEDGRYRVAIDLYRPLLAELRPIGELGWFAADAAGAFYSLDRPLPARGWMEILRLGADRNPGLGAARDALWLLRFLTDPVGADGDIETELFNWLTANRQKSESRFAEIGTAALMLLEGLGHEVPDAAWWRVLNASAKPRNSKGDNRLRRAMLRAAEANRRGETITLLLIAFGGEMPDIENAETTADAIRALRLIGLETEARKLALELAATAGH